jgi:hypothetical protein
MTETVVRIAAEKAGVIGHAATEALGRGRYQKYSTGQEIEITVFALKVEREAASYQLYRSPSWYTLDDALGELTRGRNELYLEDWQAMFSEIKSFGITRQR